MTAGQEIKVEKKDGVLRIGIDRVAKKNALSQKMYQTMADELNGNDDCRIVLLTGTDDVFTSGNDLRDFMSHPPSGDKDKPAPVENFMEALMNTNKIVVAGVNGLAIGVGVTMLMHCDLVYASSKATFKTPFVDLAVAPEFGSSQLFPLHLGYLKAADLLLLGSKWSAEKASKHGLVTEVVAHDELKNKLDEVVTTLSEKAPIALLEAKKLMRRELEPLADRVNHETIKFIELLKSSEFQEAAMAFMQKRKPQFKSST